MLSLETLKIPLTPRTLRRTLKRTLSLGKDDRKDDPITEKPKENSIAEHPIKELYYWTFKIFVLQKCLVFW